MVKDSKPLTCAIFPFYLYKFQLHFNYCCPAADHIENDLPIREQLGTVISRFLIDAVQHKQKYREDLERIKVMYQIPVVEYKDYYKKG